MKKPAKDPASSPREHHQALEAEVARLRARTRELEHAEGIMCTIAERTFVIAGEDFFRSLVRTAATTLDVRYAFVGELLTERPQRIRTLAVWSRDGFLENVIYDLAPAPCANVVGRQVCFYPSKLQELFPDDEMLVDMDAHSYLGIPLFGQRQKALGLLAFMDDKPMRNSTSLQSMMTVFAARTAAEMERCSSDQALQQAHQELERRVEERTAELSNAHEDLKSLLHIISHDLRTPLVNLRGFAGELRRNFEAIQQAIKGGGSGSGSGATEKPAESANRSDAEQLLRDDIPEAIDFIDSSVNRVDGFMNMLLRLSQEGRRRLQFQWLDLEPMVREILKILAYQLDQRQARVRIGTLPRVRADAISMEQILNNLLSNAVLYLEPSRPGRIEIVAESSDNTHTIRVQDNGRGVQPADQEKIFLPFRRGQHDDIAGEGMGLAYVKTLVQRHGGRIWCQSTPGQGTTFSLTLSRRFEAQDQPERKPITDPADTGGSET